MTLIPAMAPAPPTLPCPPRLLVRAAAAAALIAVAAAAGPVGEARPYPVRGVVAAPMQRGSVRRRRVAGGSDYTEAEIEAVELVTEEREPIPEEQGEDETAGNNKKHNKKKNNNHKNHDPSDAVLEVEIPAEDQAELVPDEAEKEEEWDWRSPEAEEEEEEEEEEYDGEEEEELEVEESAGNDELYTYDYIPSPSPSVTYVSDPNVDVEEDYETEEEDISIPRAQGGYDVDDDETATAEFPPGDPEMAEEAIEIEAEEKAAEEVGGWAFLIGMLGMIVTAWQVSENPDGFYASFCRLTLTMCGCVVKVILLPFKVVCGNFFPGSAGGKHHPISMAPDYREPYRGRLGVVEMS